MGALSIIGVSLGVGVAVYALSLRSPDVPLERSEPVRERARRWLRRRAVSTGDQLRLGNEPPPPPSAATTVPKGFVYVPVLATRAPGWRVRLGSIVGLIALVAIASIALAFGVYQLGSLLNRTISGFVGR